MEEYEENDNYENNNSENGSEDSDENIIPQMDYDPNSARRIMCVEIQNNQHFMLTTKENHVFNTTLTL